jgi:hypothetical protein
MADAIQSYANHVRRPRTWSVAMLLAFIATVLLLWGAITAPSLQRVALALLGMAVLVATTVTRMSATRLQDRIIRLEMMVRLTALGRAADLRRLSLGQLVALRFASDAELSPLIERTLTEGLTPDAIKRAVTSWQADLLRV